MLALSMSSCMSYLSLTVFSRPLKFCTEMVGISISWHANGGFSPFLSTTLDILRKVYEVIGR